MIFEGVITTLNPAGDAHITPLGYTETEGGVALRPFVPSLTLDNLSRHRFAVLNLTDDVRVTAGCLTGRRDWPVKRVTAVDGWRLNDCYRHLELEVIEHIVDEQRPTFNCRVVHDQVHRGCTGHNRARAAVIEAAILISRLDFLDTLKLEMELRYLSIAVQKTAGAREQDAWCWLLDAVTAHPRHSFSVEALR